MITKQDLYKLGYNIKTELEMGKKYSTDFRYGQPGERQYLVNLSEDGRVNIVFPMNAKNIKQFSTSSLEDFIAWHNKQ